MNYQPLTEQEELDPDVAVSDVAPAQPWAQNARRDWNHIMLQFLAITLGAAIGANMRYGISLWAVHRYGGEFPFGTLIINIIGSFVIGAVMALVATRFVAPPAVRLFTVTGLLGGFTTFSSFSYEAYALASGGHWLPAAAYVGGSILGGLIAVALGVALVHMFA